MAVNMQRTILVRIPKKRPGVVSKNRTSKLKTSKLYRKGYRGQGRV